MTAATLNLVLAQVATEASHRSVALSILIGLIASAVLIGVPLLIAGRRRRDRIELDDLATRYRFAAADDPATRARIASYIDTLFGPGPKVLRVLSQRTRALNFHLALLKIPLFRVDEDGGWDERMQESQEKLVLFVSDFEAPLPRFRLMPNSWALTTVRGREANVFETFEPFGHFNYVIAGTGESHEWIIQTLAGEPVHLLRRNKQVTIDSRDGFLAFYLQNERPQPVNLPAFIDQALAISLAIRDRTEALAAQPAATRH